MNFTRQQTVIIGFAGFVVLVFALIMTGILPGRPTTEERPDLVKGTLTVWGIFDSPDEYNDAKNAFNAKYQNVTVSFRNFNDLTDYEFALLEAFSVNRGPDIFMIPNGSTDKYVNKISPLPKSMMSLLSLRTLFPEVVEANFVRNGEIYGLPVSIDTLALIYNKDIFNQAAIITPPATWADVESLIPVLRKTDANGNLQTAAIALGANSNINNAPNILELLLLQNDELKSNAPLRNGSGSLSYFTRFSNSSDSLYTWNSGMPYSTDAFIQGRVAMVIDYGRALKELKERNPRMNIRASLVPGKNANKTVSYTNMQGYGVSLRSQKPSLAWEFITNMTTNPEVTESYFIKTGYPPALNQTIQAHINDPEWSVFARQALVASSWNKIDVPAVDVILSEAIQTVLNRELNASDALRSAEEKYFKILSRIRQ